MKATKLMIGDWVMFTDPTDGSKYPVRLKSINANSCCCIDGKSLLSLTDDFEPIPITPEILEKNGFKKSQVFDEWKYETVSTIIFWKPFPFISIINQTNHSLFKQSGCDYVHQLQHALRLCNIKKDIEL